MLLFAYISFPSLVSRVWLGICPRKDTSCGKQSLLQMLMKYFILFVALEHIVLETVSGHVKEEVTGNDQN